MTDIKNITFGAELELANVDRAIKLPLGNKWCDKDGSICNSNGTANDPKEEFNRFGGEIQTKPANSPNELLETILELYRILNVELSCFNFTTNLHVHIRVPGLKDDLELLKRIAVYTRKYDKEIFNHIAVVPKPLREDFPFEEEFDGAWKRYKRRLRSHQYSVTEATFNKMMAATTTKEFWEAHAAKDKSGKPLWHLVVRSGVNLKQLWEDTETIEFRHFTMSPDPQKMLSALRWPGIFIESVFENRSPKDTFKQYPDLTFQEFYPYKYHMDKIFQMTNVYHNSRPVVKENYEKLIVEGVLKREELGV